MLKREDLLAAVDDAKARRSDVDVSRAAGLSPSALAKVREGKVPSLERAAALADAVGLELVVRRKGEAIDQFALRLAILNMFADVAVEPINMARQAEAVSSVLAKSYANWAEALDLTLSPDARETTFKVAEDALVDLSRRLFAARLGEEVTSRGEDVAEAALRVLRSEQREPEETPANSEEGDG